MPCSLLPLSSLRFPLVRTAITQPHSLHTIVHQSASRHAAVTGSLPNTSTSCHWCSRLFVQVLLHLASLSCQKQNNSKSWSCQASGAYTHRTWLGNCCWSWTWSKAGSLHGDKGRLLQVLIPSLLFASTSELGSVPKVSSASSVMTLLWSAREALTCSQTRK